MISRRLGRLVVAALLILAACKDGADSSATPTSAPALASADAAPTGPAPSAHASLPDAPSTTPAASASAPTDAPAPADDSHLGFVSDADCKDARTMLAGAATNQLEINEHANAKATVATCAMKPVFLALRQSLNPDAATALDAAQVAWHAFSVEREGERFPHASEPGYYGSIVGLCYGALEEDSATTRTAELRALRKTCSEPASAAQPAVQAAKAADATINEVYGKIRTGYASDPTFLKALTRAQVAWLKYRDAQVALAKRRTDDSAACAEDELARVTTARTGQLRAWLKPATDGDACGGSYGGMTDTAPAKP
jgi:uncharacterized protein YecT (DUF1311 family)